MHFTTDFEKIIYPLSTRWQSDITALDKIQKYKTQ